MSVKGVLLRFFLLYTGLIIVAGLVMNHFGIKQNMGVNIGILAACIFLICGAFAKKNGRYFSKSEKTWVVLGFVAIDVALQFTFGAAALSQSSTAVGTGAITFALGFVGIIHALAIYFFVGIAKKPLIRQGIISA